jgi:hypothetical protein
LRLPRILNAKTFEISFIPFDCSVARYLVTHKRAC